MHKKGEQSYLEIDVDQLPTHIAIIMDGNGRWAKSKNKTRAAGHKQGADTLQKISEAADQLGITHLTVYAFSTENWKRPQEEIGFLMNLLRQYLDKNIKDAKKRNIRIRIIGDVERLDEDIQNKIMNIEDITKEKSGLNLHIALNYGGRDEIIRAFRKLYVEALESKLPANEISEAVFEKHLDTVGIPDPELIIRTSGEQRLSNFLLWQIAYTELCFTEKLWPDFTKQDLYEAIYQYQKRQRRFGGI